MYNTCNETEEDICDRIEGRKNKGQALLASNLDQSIFFQHLELSFLVLLPSILLSGFIFPRESMPKIIQFLHPSQEALPTNADDKIIQWNNYITHRRKFLLSKGEYINQNGLLKVDDLTFWGEWEPQSEILKIINQKSHLKVGGFRQKT